MKPSSMWVTILLLIAASLICPGCSPVGWLLPEKPVHVPMGRTVEIAEPVKFKAWILAPDGKRYKRTVQAWPTWRAGPPLAAPESEVK